MSIVDSNDDDGRDDSGLRVVGSRRWADWERAQRSLNGQAEPIVARLKAGKNYLPADKFRLVAIYLLGEQKSNAAVDSGSFAIGRIEVVRANWRSGDRVNQTTLATIAGVSRGEMSKLLSKAGIPYQVSGREKLYSFADLESLRDYFAADCF